MSPGDGVSGPAATTRALRHYWKINVAVLLAAAVNTAVLAGALVVGDSVRGSLRDMTLDRLGDIERALVAERPFPADLADRLAASGWSGGPVAPAFMLPGSATNADTGARASQANVLGVDKRFVGMFPETEGFELERGAGQIFPPVVINEALQRELGVAPGDEVLLNFRTRDEIPDDTLLGNKANTDTFGTMRATVTGVVADRGIGRFGLAVSQAFPANAWVRLADLQGALDQEGMANALFIADAGTPSGTAGGAVDAAGSSTAPAEEALRAVIDVDDLGLLPTWHEGRLMIESNEYVLRPPTLAAIEAAARAVDARVTRVTTYLANTMTIDGRSVPYSTVTALAGAPEDLAGLTLADGTPAPPPTGDQVLLDRWAFDDLQAAIGDTLRMYYYVVGPYEQLAVASHDFVVAGVVAMEGLGADRELTPDYPGIEDNDDIADWDPPFPVDLSRVRPVDEQYWDDWGPTPKAFINPETAAGLWSTRYGVVTSVRLTPRGGVRRDEFETAFENALLSRLSLAQFSMRFVPVRAEGLAASTGATDFSGLFIGFSFFIIISAALLVGLLFSLGVEERAGDVGLLLAVGYTVKRVRRQMLLEGGVVAAAGALLGLAAGVGYAALMMLGLRTLWLPAVGTTMLTLHVQPLSLAVGWAISVLVVLGSIWWTVRRLGRTPITALLKGSVFRTGVARRGRRAWRIVLAALAAAFALAMLGYAVATGTTMDPMVFGTIGFPLLIAGLAAFSEWCRGAHGRLGKPGPAALVGMAARNSAWSPGRSILSVALVAFASFVIVTVAANRRDPTLEAHSKDSGTGGFALFATSEIPLHQDLNSTDARFDLGFSSTDDDLLADAHVIALRALPGDDASCLNLYRPQNPRLVGATEELVARGGFRFAATLPPADSGAAPGGYDPANPWTLLYQDFGPDVVPVIGDLNSVQWILHLGVGDDLVVTDELGNPLSLRVVGTFAESLFRSELLMSDENLLAHFPSQSGYSTFLVDVGDPLAGAAPPEQVDAISAALERNLGPYGFDAERADRKLADYLVVQNTYLQTFQLLGGLGLLLGTIGLGVVLVRNVIERRAELATLRAFGFRRAALSRMVLAENAFLLLLGVLIGATSSIVAVAPRFVGGAFRLPWGTLGWILLAVIATGMLSSIAAVSGALRVPLLPVLKGDR
ncbi:MAG: ABC transporter permease [Acidobacteriota bacterium]